MAGYYFEVLETVKEPEAIYEGKMGECIAVRERCVYIESKEDEFVTTAFLTRREHLERRRVANVRREEREQNCDACRRAVCEGGSGVHFSRRHEKMRGLQAAEHLFEP